MALINLRNALMSGRRLPYDAEVEYLESHGTQWIDTGIVPTTTKTEITFSTPTPPSSGYMCGSFNANDNRYYPAAFSGSSTRYINLINAANTVISQHTNDGNVHTVVYNATGGACYFDGAAAGTLDTTTLTASNPIYLFCTSTSTGASGLVSGRIYSCKLYDANGTLVRDFIPVRKKTVGYLYDRVSGKLFGNAGTGDFVLGPDIVPVEYIESHGTEWIDTGLNSTTDGFCNFEISFQKTTVNTVISTRGYNPPFGYKYAATARYGIWGGTNSSITDLYAGIDVHNFAVLSKDTSWHTVKVENGVAVTIDGTSTQIGTGTVRGNIGLYLFANITSSSGSSSYIVVPSKISYCKIYNTSGNALRDYKAIRVGSGSTWEGAMMDTLTRRIYRNAGTGAFTYGNDLKYPIPSE